MAESYDNKAIKGAELKSLATEVAKTIMAKQDKITIVYDPTNEVLDLSDIDCVVED